MKVACVALLLSFFQVRGAFFESDLPPGEGPRVFEASSKVVNLRELPSISSKISKTVTVVLRQRFSFDDARYRTLQAGRIRALVDTHITGRMIGDLRRLSRSDYYSDRFRSANVEVPRGVSFEYLQYRAEGTCFVRIEGKVIDASPCPTIDKTTFKLEAEPKTELWIHVIVPGDSAGWLLVNESSLKYDGD